MIYNCVPFYNELDLLELRLHTMSSYVDKFIICEMDTTHSCLEKSFYFEENKNRFKEFESKIVHLKATSPKDTNAWVNENYQRNFIKEWLDQNCQDNDLIILQDADEVLRENFPDIIKDVDTSQPLITQVDFYRYYINAEIIGADKTWSSGPIVNYSFLKQNTNISLTDLRGLHPYLRSINRVLNNCGWHFTFLGGAEAISNKIKAYAHQESNNQFTTDITRLEVALQNNQDACNPNGPGFQKIEITEGKFPQYITNNQDKYKKYIIQ